MHKNTTQIWPEAIINKFQNTNLQDYELMILSFSFEYEMLKSSLGTIWLIVST